MKLLNKQMWMYLLAVAVVATWGLKALLPESIISQTNGTIDFLHLYFLIILGVNIIGYIKKSVENKSITVPQQLKYQLTHDEKDMKVRSLLIAVIGSIALSLTINMVFAVAVIACSVLVLVLHNLNKKTVDGLYADHLVYKGQAYKLDQAIEFKKTQDGFRFTFIKPAFIFKISHVVEFKLIVDVEHFTNLVKESNKIAA